jgi:uncharacterized protein YgbK (DUF1537 family)
MKAAPDLSGRRPPAPEVVKGGRPAAQALVILADDLTGACDAAAPFAGCGLSTEIDLGRSGCARVRAFDLDCRNRTPQETYSQAFAAGAERRDAPVGLFAKIDSTLRGNVGEFLCGIQDGARIPTLVVCPAFPRHGRQLEGARLHVADSEADARDLLEILRPFDRQLLHIPRGPSFADRIWDALASQIWNRPRVAIIDAVTDNDLAVITRCLCAIEMPVLMAGSGGLAEALAACGGKKRAPVSVDAKRDGPVVLLSGSPAMATRSQIDRLASDPAVRLFRPPFAAEISPADRIVAFATAAGSQDPEIERDGDHSAEELARQAALLAATVSPRAVLMVGGSSSHAICRHLGVEAIVMHGHALGLPHGVLRGGPWDGTPMITKPGGFGAPDLLARAVCWLAGERK